MLTCCATKNKLSDSHLSVANLGGDYWKKTYTFYCWCGGTFSVAAWAIGPHLTCNIHLLLLAGTFSVAARP